MEHGDRERREAEAMSADRDPAWGAVILHVDMDAFFLSVELRERPDLRGVPSLVAPLGGRSVVLSASYEARRFGVRSAMPLAHAQALCPSVVVLEPHHEKYREASGIVMSVFESVTPLVEQLSIDEAFLDVSGSRRRLGSPPVIARKIKDEVRRRTGLPCTVGVAATKSVAKIVSTGSKPDGLGVVAPQETQRYLAPLSVRAVWGVGPKLADRLEAGNIATIGDLAQQSPERMQRWIGSVGPGLVQLARGIDPRAVVPERTAKSHGVEKTFEVDVTDEDHLHRELIALVFECARRLRADNMVAGALSVKVRDHHRVVRTRTQSLPQPTAAGAMMKVVAGELLNSLMSERSHPVRLLGVRGERLVARGEETEDVQDALFDDPQNHSGAAAVDWERTDAVLDDLRQRFPDSMVQPATLLRRRGRPQPGSE
ncbi:MAG: DNA polymerase IV [Micrococcaceae bacterium]